MSRWIISGQAGNNIRLLFHMCELELDWLDMRINTKESCCMRVGPRFDLPCTGITISVGYSLP